MSSWDDYMINVARTQIDDWGTTQVYSDDDLKRKLFVAAQQIYWMATPVAPFDYTYEFTMPSGDVSTWDITPDPIYTSKDDEFVLLWSMKFLCDQVKYGMVKSAGNAIKIKDGDSSIDTSAGLGGYKELLANDNGPCELFSQAWTNYTTGNFNAQFYSNFVTDYLIPNYVHLDRD